ncbi:MAG: 30S ribosomal protein S9 [Candidatus Magasanikbacteria bacterium RIFOXYC2_FULL_40_16]|uniref:Small ribosomal subunit protein uS9 n=3 Tax=Candidatus Magasanikiibacteriota TaxID=1752731 RepID=A0A1F6NG12_9BACT|nr:MAG: 30S ribosomal protein S9 [Candidatus Magasanikbacteria bacterium RIFOXYA2_FULL_40_20]OGH82794.1 MAG: 30S ribosomal protein S9 [Candidatus Magasanikbacteria bacterium RIFOXYB1_FULL_40_15]OGH86978.1 MAG: 30S ribosomal protein S9 [Candidatus Magasanikbacteria bacterium RIFOXYB2_FULL_40_13]OGH87754.1 MAG: 30S ribosomal protein S9 [Candidatus Magasanikbacteria bacterium RIFOXYA1_FULL_40_8]OGH90350.1 MAG: 30S ribosomal protein S9 [Candidatus Magasanikbacteria bacterium RIFOXYC2_FULL_40_16]
MTKDTTNTKAVGRRKTSAARVRIAPGKGEIVINGKKLADYFRTKIGQDKVLAPLVAVGKEKALDVSVKVAGGGVVGQTEAVRHGIARALIKWNEDFRPALKALGYLTRDQRAKERKKPGLYKARRAHQWRKR